MSQKPRYLQIPMTVICNPKLQPLDLQVYGIINWYSHMTDKKCFASNEKIAEALSSPERTVNPKSISNSVSRLDKAGCVKVLLKPNRKRLEIIPLIIDQLSEEPEDSESVPSNNGTRESIEVSVPLNDGRADGIVPSDDGGKQSELEVVPSNDGELFHQTMERVPSNDGYNSNTQEKEINRNINTSSNEEEQQKAAPVFNDEAEMIKFWEGSEDKPSSEPPTNGKAESEKAPVAVEGELVKLTKSGKPVKPKREPNSDGSFGDPDVNEGMTLLVELSGSRPSGNKWNLNRYALNRLYKAHGKERVLSALRLAYNLRGVQYAPQIYNYLDLEDKWPRLYDYANRKATAAAGMRVQPKSSTGNGSKNYENTMGGNVTWVTQSMGVI